MKLRYKGLIERGVSGGGCSKCGGSRVVNGGHIRPTRQFILKSNEFVTMRVNGIYELSDADAYELLKYNSPAREVFEVVEI